MFIVVLGYKFISLVVLHFSFSSFSSLWPILEKLEKLFNKREKFILSVPQQCNLTPIPFFCINLLARVKLVNDLYEKKVCEYTGSSAAGCTHVEPPRPTDILF